MVAQSHTFGIGRVLRVFAYALLAAAGLVLFIIGDEVFPIMSAAFWTWTFMCWFLVIGGVASALGQATKHWTGEFIGLPLVGSALIVFGVLQGGLSQWELVGVPGVALLWAFGLVLIGRWRDIAKLVRAAPQKRAR